MGHWFTASALPLNIEGERESVKRWRKERSAVRRDYEKRTDYAAQKKNEDQVINVMVGLHKERDSDLIAMLDLSKPPATQVKEIMRSKKLKIKKQLEVCS